MWQASPEGGGGGSVAKRTIWEAGHRVPSIIYWPDHIEVSTYIIRIVLDVAFDRTVASG
jgi:arylsulfatase A-like enzyme